MFQVQSVYCALYYFCVCSLVVLLVESLPAMWETQVQSLDLEGLLEKEMTAHSSILA